MLKLALRLALSSVVIVTVVTPSAAPAVEDPTQADCRQGATEGEIICRDIKTGVVTVIQSSQPSGLTPVVTAVSSGSTKTYVPYNRLGTGPDGQPCATTGYVEQGVTPPDERLLADPNPRESNIPITGSDFSILETYPPCPEQPRAPGQPAPAETRAMVASRFWEQVQLPKPKPEIDPGRAITGKLAYLETKGQTSLILTENTESFGLLRIVARGRYEVNWGDGVITKDHRLEGQPWPMGLITHEYLNVGTYNIVVTEYWEADWQLDGESGRLRTLRTTGRLNNFPVEQLQAVIGR